MAGYNFKTRAAIEKVYDLIEMEPEKPKPKQGARPLPSITKGWVFKTPAGGIPARSGTTCGSAECTPYYIDTDGELAELKDTTGASFTVTIYHIGSSAVQGNAYIQAKEVFGLPVVDMEDCGA